MKDLLKPKSAETDKLLKEMTIRRIKRDEFSQLFELVNEAFRGVEGITGLNAQRLYRLSRLYWLIEILLPIFEFFHTHLETILVAVSGEKLIAFYHFHPLWKDIWSLDSAAVGKMFRGHGVFKRLFNQTLKYILDKGGRKAVMSSWTDNIAVAKTTNKLGFQVYAEEALLKLEIDGLPDDRLDTPNALIRKMESADSVEVMRLSRTLDAERVKILEITEKNLVGSFMDSLRSRLTWTHSERWIMENRAEIIGYVHITYTPPQQSGEIRSFYVISPNECSEMALLLLRRTLDLLRRKNIKRVTTFLNKKRKRTLDMFKHCGFTPISSVYEWVIELN